MEQFLPIIVMWVICAVIGGLIGAAKGRTEDGILLGMLLGWCGILIICFLPGGVQCSYCRKYINKQATICPYCQSGKRPTRG